MGRSTILIGGRESWALAPNVVSSNAASHQTEIPFPAAAWCKENERLSRIMGKPYFPKQRESRRPSPAREKCVVALVRDSAVRELRPRPSASARERPCRPG
jgi:hypothetical protein